MASVKGALCVQDSCECAKAVVYRRKGVKFESQTDEFRCGPIAILNALHHSSRYSGRALRRQVAVLCGARLTTPDGFCGTRPAGMTAAIAKYWNYDYHVGRTDCLSVLERAPVGTAIIFLYRAPAERIAHRYHYVYAHKEPNGWQFENCDEAGGARWYTRVEECVYPRTDYLLPQIWVLGGIRDSRKYL